MTDEEIERNKAVARAVFNVWSTGDIERLDQLAAADVIHHDPYDPHAADGLPGMRRTIEINRDAFPNMRLTDTLGLLRGIGAL